MFPYRIRVVFWVSCVFFLLADGVLYAQSLADQFLKAAQIYREQNRLDEAIDAYSKALKEDLNFSEAYFDRG